MAHHATHGVPARILAWVLAALPLLVLLQVFFAGAFLLGGKSEPFTGLHIGLGHLLAPVALIACILAFVARDRTAGWTCAVLFLLIFVQTPLVMSPGVLRGLHVVNAFLVFGTSLWLLKDRQPWAASARRPAALGALPKA